MKVYVVYENFGWEGCTPPTRVFSSWEKAEAFVESTKYNSNMEIEEMEVE